MLSIDNTYSVEELREFGAAHAVRAAGLDAPALS